MVAPMLRDDLTLVRDVLLHDGVPTDPDHPRRVALEAIERNIDALRIQGSPSECGSDLILRFVLPAMRGIQGANPQDMANLYGGMLMSVLGAMAADFGQQATARMAHELVDVFAGLENFGGAVQ